MKTTIFRTIAGLALAAALSPAFAADAAKPAAATHPSADSILKKMSDTLAGAKQYSFKGTRVLSSALAADKNMQAKSDITVTVQRPDRVVATSSSGDTVRSLYFDGANFTMMDGKTNMYSTVVMKATLDTLPVQLAANYGIIPPLSDFAVSNPYKDMKRRAKSVTYVGTDTAGTPAVPTYHLKLGGTVADSDLWIGVDDHLPRKMTANVKSGANKGAAVAIEFTEWNLSATVTDQTFAFVQPKGAQSIPMVTTAEIQAAAAKAAEAAGGTAAKK